MNIKFKIQGTKEMKKLYVRVYFSKVDICVPTQVVIRKTDFDELKQKSKIAEVNILMSKLTSLIMTSWNKALLSGEIISKDWLVEIVNECMNRPSTEKKLVNLDHTIYFTDFCDWWLETHAENRRITTTKVMSKTLIDQYKNFAVLFKNYEQACGGKKLEMRKVTQSDLYSFISYMQDQNYSSSTINRNIKRLKFFYRRALSLGFDISNAFAENMVYESENNQEDFIYLNQDEINKIVTTKVPENLEKHKQTFVIALYTGLRISDFSRLDLSNFKNNLIEIQTQKTKEKVVIPIHPVVKEIIDKNFGFLPRISSKKEFNKNIKEICKLAQINDLVLGSKFDAEKNRKIIKHYYKHELVTSHTCRRSFCTNHIGLLPDHVLSGIMGWSKNSNMIQTYNKTTKEANAKKLAELWEKINN